MKEELFDKRFRIIATVLLALVIVTIPVLSLITKVSFDNYYNMVSDTRLPKPANMRKSVESWISAWPFSNLEI